MSRVKSPAIASPKSFQLGIGLERDFPGALVATRGCTPVRSTPITGVWSAVRLRRP